MRFVDNTLLAVYARQLLLAMSAAAAIARNGASDGAAGASVSAPAAGDAQQST